MQLTRLTAGTVLLLALAAGHALRALLVGVSPYDPLAFGGAILLALVMVLAGTLPPALRALRLE